MRKQKTAYSKPFPDFLSLGAPVKRDQNFIKWPFKVRTEKVEYLRRRVLLFWKISI